MIVEVENIGAIYLTCNTSSSVHTKHVDLQYHFICGFYQQGVLLVTLVNIKLQCSDLMTKNVNAVTHEDHA